MSSCNRQIIFKDLKEISRTNRKKSDDFLIHYLNSFEGENIFEKFKNILLDWETDVSPSLNLNLNDKSVKISLSYILSQIPDDLGDFINIKDENLEIILDIPKSFDILVQETIPIYSLLNYINISGISIDLIDLSIGDRKNIIDNLPAKVYNPILKEIIENKTKLVKFDNESLSNFRFNFLTNEPYLFLRGLFNNFGEDYFRDAIFHLSKRIDSEILLNSTPIEIEYYIQKMSEEMKSQNDGLHL